MGTHAAYCDRVVLVSVPRTLFLVRKNSFLMKFGSSYLYHILSTNVRNSQLKFPVRLQDFVGAWFPGSPWFSDPVPHDGYNLRGIAHVRTNRRDDIFMQRRLYIDEAHTALDIFGFAIFLYLYSVSLGDALTTAAVRPFLYVCIWFWNVTKF